MVKKSTIVNCFRHCGLDNAQDDNNQQNDMTESTEYEFLQKNINEWAKKTGEGIICLKEFIDFERFDDAQNSLLSETEIIDMVEKDESDNLPIQDDLDENLLENY